MCEGRFHILFRKSRKFQSLVSRYGSEPAPEGAHKHQKHLLVSHSAAHPQSHQLFLAEGPNSITLAADGIWRSGPCLWASLRLQLRGCDLGLHSPYPSLLGYWQWWKIGWPHGFYYFINRWYWRLQHSFSETLSSVLILSTIRLALNQPSQDLIWCPLNLFSQIGLKIDEAVPEDGMSQAHTSPSLSTGRFRQRTNQWRKVEILLRRVTLIIKSKLGPCGASQNQSCVWTNTLCFNKTVAKGVSQVHNHIPRTPGILLTPKWPMFKSIMRPNT